MTGLFNKRVVFIFTRLELGGAERQGLLLARHLKEQCGTDVRIVGMQGEQGELSRLCDAAGIPNFSLRLGTMQNSASCLLALVKFIWRLRLERPDLLVSYTRNANVFSGLAWRICGARGFVWNQADEGLHLNGELASRFAVSLTPCFISNSSGGAAFLREFYRVPSSKLRIIYNGISLAPPVSARLQWRKRIGIGGDVFVASMVANISLLKDHATLLQAWRLVLNRITTVKPVLLLAGRFDLPHQEILGLCHALNLGDSVKFLGAVDDVSGLLGASDMFVYSSRSEGLPNAVIEAMAAGLPVTGTAIPGIREAVGSFGEQFLASPDVPDELAERIILFILEPQLRLRYGDELRIRASKEFSLCRMLELSTESFASALNEKTGKIEFK